MDLHNGLDKEVYDLHPTDTALLLLSLGLKAVFARASAEPQT